MDAGVAAEEEGVPTAVGTKEVSSLKTRFCHLNT